MINQILDDIIKAEQDAELVRVEAEKTARDIGLSTANDIEKVKAEYYAKTKTETDAIKKKAEQDAEIEFEKIIDSAKAEAKAVIDKASKNTASAVDKVVEQILKVTKK